MDVQAGRTIWDSIPVRFAVELRGRVDRIAAEMVDAVRREVPDYRQPLGSPLGRDLVVACTRALHQFADLVSSPHPALVPPDPFFAGLGRAEYRNGRVLDSLQAAYRVGARVACRAYTTLARESDLPADAVVVLGEAVLVHIDALAGASAEGYAQERDRDEPDRQAAARRALGEQLLDRHAPAPSPAAAAAARWPLPRRLACAVVARAVDHPGVLVVAQGHDHVLIAAPDVLVDAVRDRSAVVGPAVPLDQGWLSLACARSVARLVREGAIEARGHEVVLAEEHLADVLLVTAPALGGLLAGSVLARVDALGGSSALRMVETLDALLGSWGRTAPEVAERLGIHPQTARTRLRRLDEVLGDQLKDPDSRLAVEMALRLRALSRGDAGGR
ncbi:helix-turn-helix domain-containing protein [Actinokineospora bangkokensis]|uniref:helix-turn-helix domain-containing protein n=1 Tax=Actinokineospora bangkokensis TaxID=1193682 RepID=UPI0011785F3B|nr:helix-turn-helix domain-containing protein [Actinokineospora bangkokensis]